MTITPPGVAWEDDMLFRFRPLAVMLAVGAALVLIASSVDARPGGGGSRGSRTFSAPPSTTTAPGARPLERTMTTPSTATAPRAATQPGGFFNRPGMGFMGGLAAGFLGAGLLGLLFGGGLSGGLGGFASILGLVLQIGLIAVVGYLLYSWWQRRSQPQTAMASGPSMREAAPNTPQPMSFGGLGAGLGGASQQPALATQELQLTEVDFNDFEKLLGEVQTAYGAEDIAALRSRLTPEMLSYFNEDLAKNASRGLVNQISDVKLLQGDLSEAWREPGAEYATVAMRYSLTDKLVERASGKVVDGGPQETTEFWTFRRAPGGSWILSAIQESA
jgi:predicted lipid-binding transport protein (Tim44 family)